MPFFNRAEIETLLDTYQKLPGCRRTDRTWSDTLTSPTGPVPGVKTFVAGRRRKQDRVLRRRAAFDPAGRSVHAPDEINVVLIGPVGRLVIGQLEDQRRARNPTL
jgi:hypothetical protein